MENIFIVALLISVVFFVVKFIEMRFIEKETKPFKTLIKDAIWVYFSVIITNYVVLQIYPVMTGGKQTTPVFTDNPGF